MRIYHHIPEHRPATPLLDQIDSPRDLRELSRRQLPQLADELRSYLLYSVGQSGGHFGAGLGVVELTIALHYLLDTPEDRLLWDVGHQAYPHKILTERRERMPSIRQKDGLAAFPARHESEYDTFGVGHSSTSISAGIGMAMAAQLKQDPRRVVSVIGDGALTAGMAFEALAHGGANRANMLVVLNDNDMSISDSVGGLSNYLAQLLASKAYTRMRDDARKLLDKVPPAAEFVRKTEEQVKAMVSPASLFEAMGWNYIGPIDGHDINQLLNAIDTRANRPGPNFLHVVTQKGCGFAPAEDDPIKFHAITKISAKTDVPVAKPKTFSNIFGQWMCDLAAADDRVVGITPAMREGSDLVQFSQSYPERYQDVAICEQHAVTLAAGYACEGLKPVVAIYSTFLQRGYDQLVHDVAIQDLDVTFAIDRAGLVGEDGPTHAGAYDIAYLRCLPRMIIATPSDESEARLLLQTAYDYEGPSAVRYPRGAGIGNLPGTDLGSVEIGQARELRQGHGIAILNFGPHIGAASAVAEKLDLTVIDMRWVKPIDRQAITRAAASHAALVTLEDHAIQGGAGSAVLECLAEQGLEIPVLNLGIPDQYIEGAKPSEMYAQIGLDAAGIKTRIQDRFGLLIKKMA